MPVKKAPKKELSKMRHSIAAADAETVTERRIKQEIANTAVKFPGSSREQCRKLANVLGGLFIELELEMMEPKNCLYCGHGLDEGRSNE